VRGKRCVTARPAHRHETPCHQVLQCVYIYVTRLRLAFCLQPGIATRSRSSHYSMGVRSALHAGFTAECVTIQCRSYGALRTMVMPFCTGLGQHRATWLPGHAIPAHLRLMAHPTTCAYCTCCPYYTPRTHLGSMNRCHAVCPFCLCLHAAAGSLTFCLPATVHTHTCHTTSYLHMVHTFTTLPTCPFHPAMPLHTTAAHCLLPFPCCTCLLPAAQRAHGLRARHHLPTYLRSARPHYRLPTTTCAYLRLNARI